MRTLPFLYILLICQPCSLAGPIGCDSKEGEVTLDLFSPDASLFSLADDELYRVNHKAFVPRNGYSLVAIIDGGIKVWTRKDEEGSSTGAYLFSRDGFSSLLSIHSSNEVLCMEKDEQGWHGIEKREFERKLHSMKDFAMPVDKYEEDFSRPLHNDHHSDDGRCEGGTRFNGPPQRDKEHATQHVRRESLEHEPKSHVRAPQHSISQEPKGDGISIPINTNGEVLSKRDLNHGGEPRSAGHAREPLKIVLDISSPNSSSIDTFTRMPYEMLQTIYYPKSGYRITSVIESGRDIWKAPDGHSCTHVNVLTHGDKRTHMNIYVRNQEGAMNVLYYRMKSYKWEITTEDAFYSSFHLEAIKGSIIETIALDVKGNNDASKLYVNDSPNFQFTAYAPNVGYRISAVKEGSTNIWEAASEDQGCLYASFYPKEAPTLAYLIIHSSEDLQELYYSKNGTTWTSVNKDVYLVDLKKAGFKIDEFTNEITIDISNVNKDSFHITEYSKEDYSIHLYTPSVGLQLKSIVDGSTTIWTGAKEKHCTYINTVCHNGAVLSIFIFVDDPKNGRNVLYFIKSDDAWKGVTKSEYHALIPVKLNGMALPKMDGQKITMSSFRNRQGLKITGYSSTVNSSKGDIILVHGLRSHFMSEFSTSSMEWNFEHFGSPPFLNINGLFLNESKHKRNLVEMYRHLFEHASLDGKDASLVQPGYEYEGSFIEFLNKMGYNVYGFDLQSHGLSEAQTENKCHVESYADYLHDVIQFVNIIRRGKFSDPTEKWNEETVLKSLESHRKTILWGNSMGGNLVIQAVQEFYKEVNDANAHFVDGIIVTSGMLNIDHYLDTWWKKLAKWWLAKCSCCSCSSCSSCCSCSSCFSCCNFFKLKPTDRNPYETPLDFGSLFDLFLRHRDPLFNTSKLTLKTTLSMFDACTDVKKDDRMAHYPKDLPIILFHAKKDVLCDVKGPRDVVNKLNGKKVTDVNLVEINTSFHYLNAPQGMVVLQSQFKEWLDKHVNA